jgi:hypothetical protein
MASLEIKGTEQYIKRLSKHLKKEHPSTKKRMKVKTRKRKRKRNGTK